MANLPPIAELPPLPVAALTPDLWRASVALPRSALAGFAISMLGAAALITKSWLLGGAAMVAMFVLVGGTTVATALAHEALRPALVSAKRALVLVDVELTDDGWIVHAMRLPVSIRRGLGSAPRALGYLAHDLYRACFLPFSALCAPHQVALARAERADAAYFELLERCEQDGRSQGDRFALSLSHAAFAEYFVHGAGSDAPEGAPSIGPSASASQGHRPGPEIASADSETSAPESWCAGLPLAGTVPLGAVEGSYLRHTQADLRRKAALWSLHALLGIAAMLGMLCTMAHVLTGPLAMLSLVGLFLWAPWAVRPALVAYAVGGPVVYRWLGDQLASWVLWIHALILVGIVARSYRRWRSQRLLERELMSGWVLAFEDANHASRCEFLPSSGTPWSSNGVSAPWRRQEL